MKKYAPIAIISILLVSLLAACSSSEEAAAENEETEQQPIIVEGPMPIEAEKFAERLDNVEEEKSGSFVFYKGTVNDYPVIVAKTGKG
ncbi:MAG: 5'-methylthioadenosine nucleosidase, partial [Halobacillus sp.]